MTRGSFFKSLITLALSPKIIAEINFTIPVVNNTASLFSEFTLLVPNYYETFIQKYGSRSYLDMWSELGENKIITDNNDQ